MGHSLTIKNIRARDNVVVWRCTSRPNENPCRAIVWQDGLTFKIQTPHTCAEKPDLQIKVAVVSEAKKVGLENKFESAANIVEPILQAKFKENVNCELPKPDDIARIVNRATEKLRPKNPLNLNFKIKEDCISKNSF